MQTLEETTSTHSNDSVLSPIDHPESIRRRKIRHGFEHFLKICISLGGHSVIAAIVLIFFFLIFQIWPLLKGADIQEQTQYHLTDMSDTQISLAEQVYLAIEEQGEVAVQFYKNGLIHFFNAHNGKSLLKTRLSLPDGIHISSFSASDSTPGLVAYGLNNGCVILLKHQYQTVYENDKRIIRPSIEYPLGQEPLVIDADSQTLTHISVQKNDQELTISAFTDDRRLLLYHHQLGQPRFSMTNDETHHTPKQSKAEQNDSSVSGHVDSASRYVLDIASIQLKDSIEFLLLNKTQENLFLILKDKAGESWLHFYHVKDKKRIQRIQVVKVAGADEPLTAASFLTGGISLLLGKQSGEITQWFPVNKENIGFQLTQIRQFDTQTKAISQIVAEPERKGFFAIDKSGQVGLYYTTSNASLLVEQISKQSLKHIAVAKRSNYLLAQDTGNSLSFWTVDNEYPEVSLKSLWGKVWYESYSEPDYVWQSSSASNDFEPKFSLTPLAFGTLKAAFYAMLFATPLAVMGAIYTAYFMNARMRNLVKPTVEIMEALPTVIIGFLAGLWLAPFVDQQLFAVLSLLFILPLGVLVTAGLWHAFSLHRLWNQTFKHSIADGWEALILVPVIIFLIWGTVSLSQPVEQWLFSGSMQSWLSNELGYSFDQRNAIIVGIAMGFAVIPTIFSITEDAVFNVPSHLTNGSMALGATRWQTLIRVVILTASPAIFSAIMIGLGRAIGETMIVLMATGNTPIMDFSIFQGMRTLSANIAIEIPESEIGSSHYRILFLAAFILFLFTFFFNTIAEVIRQRLRRKYSQL